MANLVQDITHLIATEQVDEDEWLCLLCGAGPIFNNHLVMHPCGIHQFHCSCLTLRLLENRECPVCNSVGGDIAAVNNIKLGASDNRMRNFPEICVMCRDVIKKLKLHVQLDHCGHRMHRNCFLDLILEYGITMRGEIPCVLCLLVLYFYHALFYLIVSLM